MFLLEILESAQIFYSGPFIIMIPKQTFLSYVSSLLISDSEDQTRAFPLHIILRMLWMASKYQGEPFWIAMILPPSSLLPFGLAVISRKGRFWFCSNLFLPSEYFEYFGTFWFCSYLFCRPFGGRDTLKKPRFSKRSGGNISDQVVPATNGQITVKKITFSECLALI